MAREAKSSPSWGVIILLLIVFWPVGLYMLFKKQSTNRTASLGDGKGLRVTGWVFIVLGVLYIGLSGTDAMVPESGEGTESASETTIESTTEITSEAFAMVGVFFVIGGGVMLIAAKRKRKKTNKYKKYIAIITNNRVRQIDSIADAFPTTYQKARADLQEMIDKGFFEDAYIDESKREIVLANQEQFGQIPLTEKQSNQSQYSQVHVTRTIITNQDSSMKEEKTPEKKGPRVVICKNCGANNNIDGEVGECEYCGSPIK